MTYVVVHQWSSEVVDRLATKHLPAECNARVMTRTVTCGEWEET